MTQVYIAYGRKRLKVNVPSERLISVAEPRQIPGAPNPRILIEEALQNPVGLPPLKELVRSGQCVTIVTDDITRPTPSKLMLEPVIEQLEACGVQDEDIKIVFANGSHRPHTDEERVMLLGETFARRFKIYDHSPFDKENLVDLGVTTRGTPVHINRHVAEADVRILLGLIKPHAVAGYSGGGKSILPGVSGIDTIIADHSFEATGHHCSVLGVIDGNPIRSDIEEAAGMLGPCFIVNAVLNTQKEIVAIVAGHMIQAHRRGAIILDGLVKVPISEKADIVIAGVSHPTSISLYQSVNGVLNCVRLQEPIVKKGGTVILASPCAEGIGQGPFYDLVKGASSPQEVFKKLQEPGFFVHDQWAAQLWALCLDAVHVIVVSDGIEVSLLESMLAQSAKSVEEAIIMASQQQGEDSRIVVVPDAPYTLPYLVK